jgi:hypothetical protein
LTFNSENYNFQGDFDGYRALKTKLNGEYIKVFLEFFTKNWREGCWWKFQEAYDIETFNPLLVNYEKSGE